MVADDESFKARFKEAIVSRWEDLRERSVFYQARLGIIVLYAVVVLMTVIIAPPRVDDVEFRWGKVAFGASYKSYVEITNNDLGNIRDVVVEVSGSGLEFDGKRKNQVWATTVRTLAEGKATRLEHNVFKDAKERKYPAPADIDVTYVTLKNEDGDVIAKGKPVESKKAAR